MTQARRDFGERHRGLVWSDPQADDPVFIRAALLRAEFQRLLDIALEFGPPRLRQEWNVLLAEGAPETERARSSVERILKNIDEGLALVAARN
ncbi:MAG: hypothetical protein FJ403_14240 [Verrucomicrobia bacterium]|nr:hypothetical protein [Verrucomicrobiota bacterium]